MAEPISIIRNIIIKEMDLKPDRIWIYNADAPLPKDSGLFCILSLNAQNPFSNNVKYEGSFEDDTLNEVQTMNVQADITVSLLSKDNSARSRAYEVQMALGSTYSQQMQEKNKMHKWLVYANCIVCINLQKEKYNQIFVDIVGSTE